MFEALFRLFPGIIPSWYRETLPHNGIDLFYPGITAATPITGVPLPLINPSYSGPPPSGLQDIGLVSPEKNPDPCNYPVINLPTDRMGFPNQKVLDFADIILVGDSFALCAGVSSPIGLQQDLIKSTNLSVYNLGIAGIGPTREKWLLKNIGLPKKPKVVIWFFYAGNDTVNELKVQSLIKKNISNYSQLYPNYEKPFLIIHDIVNKFSKKKFIKSESNQKQQSPLDGFIFNNYKKNMPMWFFPMHLRHHKRTIEDWKNDSGWKQTQNIIKNANRIVTETDSVFILIYIPTKSQVYLPFVKKNEELLYQTACFDIDTPLNSSISDFYQQVIINKNNLELLFRQFCKDEGILYLSATPFLEELAKSGKVGYLLADTHWNNVGQKILLDPIIDLLKNNNIL